MKKGIFIVLAIVILSLFVAKTSITTSNKIEANVPRSEELVRKIQLATWQVPRDILERMFVLNDDRHIQTEKGEYKLNEMDVIILFARGWEDSFNFPFASDLLITPDRLSALENERPDFPNELLDDLVLLNDETGRITNIFIINAENIALISQNCVANLLYDLTVYYSGKDGEKLNNLDNYRLNCGS